MPMWHLEDCGNPWANGTRIPTWGNPCAIGPRDCPIPRFMHLACPLGEPLKCAQVVPQEWPYFGASQKAPSGTTWVDPFLGPLFSLQVAPFGWTSFWSTPRVPLGTPIHNISVGCFLASQPNSCFGFGCPWHPKPKGCLDPSFWGVSRNHARSGCGLRVSVGMQPTLLVGCYPLLPRGPAALVRGLGLRPAHARGSARASMSVGMPTLARGPTHARARACRRLRTAQAKPALCSRKRGQSPRFARTTRAGSPRDTPP